MEIVHQDMNFTKAAQQLFTSQPALSKQIAKLEEELGITLFDTTQKKAVKLTPAGKIFYEFFEDVNNGFQQAFERAMDASQKPFGEIKIACLNGTYLPDIQQKISQFSRKYTDVTLTFVSGGFQSVSYGLDHGDYDMAITIESHFRNCPDICMKEIAQTPMIFVYSAYGELAAGNPTRPIDFKDELLYVLSSREAPVAKSVNEEICRTYGFMPEIKIMPNLDSIILAIESGKGFALFNDLTRIKDSSLFRYLKLDNMQGIVAVWKSKNKRAAVQKFIEECL